MKTKPRGSLSTENQNRILWDINKNGKVAMCRKILAIDELASDSSAVTQVNALIREPGRKWGARWFAIWKRIARELPASEPKHNPPANAQAAIVYPAQQQLETRIASLRAEIRSEIEAKLRKEIKADMPQVAKRAVLEVVPLQLPASTPNGVSIGQFPAWDDATKREMLNQFHKEIARQLQAESGLQRCLSMAWNMSYRAYEEATGVQCRNWASSLNDAGASTTRLMPIDHIQANGDLNRFFSVIRAYWNRPQAAE